MLNKLKRSDNKGFTIIEVMIVLAIAGLILLIVFLAVPALQRNSRNTQRKSDVGRIGSAVTTVISNSNGQVNTTVLTGGAGGTIAKEVGNNLSYYTTASIANTLNGAQTVTPTNSNITVVANAACGTGSGTTYTTTAANRQVAIIYATEGGGGAIPVCFDQ
jgi:prepilin-type N-terminal cleavage/methylation domain-containing protein